MTIQELREARAKAGNKITELAGKMQAEKRDLTAEERTAWDAANADFDRLGRELKDQERAEQVRKEMLAPAGDANVGRDDVDRKKDKRQRRQLSAEQAEEYRGLALKAWFRTQKRQRLTERQRQACRALRFDPRQGEIELVTWGDKRLRDVQQEWRGSGTATRAMIMARESRANLSAQSGTSGQYLVSPGTLAASFELNLLAFGGALNVADIFTTEGGEPYFQPTVDDTANSGALLAENTTIGAGVNPSIAQKRFDAFKFTSTPVLIPSELLEDESYDLDSQLGEMLGTRLGRGQAPYLATGTGASQPQGIVTGATLGVTTASSTAITFDELVSQVHKIDPAYRSMPGVGWLMHDLIKAYIRKIKDGAGRPLWVAGENYNSGIKEGEPDSLLGYPIAICQEMDSTVATTKKTLLFGLLSKFKVRRVRGVRLYRLVERYRDVDQDAFIAFQRVDSRLVDAGTHPVKYLLQA